MKQTAVDSLIEKILPFIDRSKVSDTMLQDIAVEHLEMEKSQLYHFYMQGGIDFFSEADRTVEDFYNEEFKSE